MIKLKSIKENIHDVKSSGWHRQLIITITDDDEYDHHVKVTDSITGCGLSLLSGTNEILNTCCNTKENINILKDILFNLMTYVREYNPDTFSYLGFRSGMLIATLHEEDNLYCSYLEQLGFKKLSSFANYRENIDGYHIQAIYGLEICCDDYLKE